MGAKQVSSKSNKLRLLQITREKALLELFDALQLFYLDLHRIILEYEKFERWETTASDKWKVPQRPFELISYRQYIYLCCSEENLYLKYNSDGEIIEQEKPLDGAWKIDIDINKSLLYIAGKTQVTLVPLQSKKPLFPITWAHPAGSTWSLRSMKADGNSIYFAINTSQIFRCHSQNGKVLNKFGTKESSNKPGEFDEPRGMTIGERDMKFLYICDSANHRIQILTKEKGKYITQWGLNKEGGTEKTEFSWPYSIYYDSDPKQNIFYIGDQSRVSVLSVDGQTLQRLDSTFGSVFGLCKGADDRLYVGNINNSRIHIFRRQN